VLLTLALPPINQLMTVAVIRKIYGKEGDFLTIGAKLMDIAVDLSSVAPHDCPPISFYRIALRERAWLRRLDVAPGGEAVVGASLACFSTEAEEPLTGTPGRAARITLAGILDQTPWWSGAAP
jgi:hypothetical protein